MTQTIRGTIRRGVAHGTFAATIEIVDPATGAKVTSCRSGTLRWAARSAPGRVYAGLTSARVPIVVERSRSGRKVNSMWVSWSAPCRSEGGFAVAEELVNFPVSGAGRFGDTFSDEVKLDGVGTRAFAYRLDGTAGASRAAGTLRVEITDKDAAGATDRHLRHHARELDRALDQGPRRRGSGRRSGGSAAELAPVGAHPQQRAVPAGRALGVARAAPVAQQVDVQLELARRAA